MSYEKHFRFGTLKYEKIPARGTRVIRAMGKKKCHFNTCFCPRPKFWENLTSPLFGTLSPPSETSEVSYVEGRAEVRVPEQKGWSVAS